MLDYKKCVANFQPALHSKGGLSAAVVRCCCHLRVQLINCSSVA